MRTLKSKFSKAFTLVELLIVIAIIGILTVAFLPTIRGAPGKARDAAKRQLLSDIQNVLENMVNEGKDIPGSMGTGECFSDYTDATEKTIATALGHVPQIYNKITDNSLCDGGQVYYYPISKTSYILAIGVENASGANVIGGVNGNAIKNYTKTDEIITATSGTVGEGTNGKGDFYYVLTK